MMYHEKKYPHRSNMANIKASINDLLSCNEYSGSSPYEARIRNKYERSFLNRMRILRLLDNVPENYISYPLD